MNINLKQGFHNQNLIEYVIYLPIQLKSNEQAKDFSKPRVVRDIQPKIIVWISRDWVGDTTYLVVVGFYTNHYSLTL